ncbi:hypothetical protein D3C72_2038590 [compost metagenome]
MAFAHPEATAMLTNTAMSPRPVRRRSITTPSCISVAYLDYTLAWSHRISSASFAFRRLVSLDIEDLESRIEGTVVTMREPRTKQRGRGPGPRRVKQSGIACRTGPGCGVWRLPATAGRR